MSKEGKPDYSVREEIVDKTRLGERVLMYNRYGQPVGEYRALHNPEWDQIQKEEQDFKERQFEFEFQKENPEVQMELDTDSEKFLENFPENWEKIIEDERQKEEA